MSRTSLPSGASTASPALPSNAATATCRYSPVARRDSNAARRIATTAATIIFVGEVVEFDSFGRAPLVFHGGNYGLLMKKETQDVEDASSSFGNGWLGFLLGRAYYQLLMPLRAEVARQGLDDIHYSILSALSTGEGRTVSELAAWSSSPATASAMNTSPPSSNAN
jgi:hypothetical protein